MPRLTFRTLGRKGEPWPSWVRDLASRSGVYLIKSKRSRRVVYVGESHTGKLYGTLTRHFQRWKGQTAGHTFNRSGVLVAVLTSGPRAAQRLQSKLIEKHQPDYNLYLKGGEDVPF